MKIKELELNNFNKFDKISVNFNDDITYLVGPNGAGKTTVGVTAIWAILKGVAERGDVLKGKRVDFIKEGAKNSDNKIVLSDGDKEYTVRRKISPKKTELVIDGYEGNDPQGWINGFFNNFMLAPLDFTKLPAKDQALALGVDTSEYDAKIKGIKEDFTILNKEFRNFGDIVVPEKVEEVDTTALSNELHSIIKSNSLAKHDVTLIALKKDHLLSVKKQEEEALSLYEKLVLQANVLEKEINNLESNVADFIDTSFIEGQLEDAQGINHKAALYQNALEEQRKKEAKRKEISENKNLQKLAYNEKVSYLRSINLPFYNMSIDEAGGLKIDDRYLREPFYSTGELILMTSRILASRNPELKYLFIQSFDLLDENNQAKLINELTSEGYQLVIEKVGTATGGENSIILTTENS